MQTTQSPNANAGEILRDIPLLHQRIAQAQESILGFERSIDKERNDALTLRLSMQEDELRVAQGKKPRYEAAAMSANIERHSANIKTFEATIAKERENIARLKGMIATLEADLKRPEEVTFHFKDMPTPQFLQ